MKKTEQTSEKCGTLFSNYHMHKMVVREDEKEKRTEKKSKNND